MIDISPNLVISKEGSVVKTLILNLFSISLGFIVRIKGLGRISEDWKYEV